MSGKSLVLATALDDDKTTSAIMRGREKIGETTQTGLILYDPRSHSIDEFLQMGRLLGDENRRLQWVIGDWLVLVEDIYPDRYSQAVHATGLAEQTLINRASICRRIPPPQRVAGVGFSVHAELAYKFEPRERAKWLKLAKEGDWTREVLREHLHHERESDSVGDLAVSSNAGSVEERLLGELEPSPTHTCPNCGHEFGGTT